jgi:hypothetical protein
VFPVRIDLDTSNTLRGAWSMPAAANGGHDRSTFLDQPDVSLVADNPQPIYVARGSNDVAVAEIEAEQPAVSGLFKISTVTARALNAAPD